MKEHEQCNIDGFLIVLGQQVLRGTDKDAYFDLFVGFVDNKKNTAFPQSC